MMKLLPIEVEKKNSITSKQQNGASTRPHEEFLSGSQCKSSDQKFKKNMWFKGYSESKSLTLAQEFYL
jgi:hypothetical protein